mgnify:CR=1 FL=1
MFVRGYHFEGNRAFSHAELAKVTGKCIHEPHLMTPDEQNRAGCRIGVEYPAPLVDHAEARREYLDLGKQLGMK